MKKIKMGVVGLGMRGYSMICGVLTKIDDIELIDDCEDCAGCDADCECAGQCDGCAK